MAGQIILYPKDLTVAGGVVSVNTTAVNGFQSWEYGGVLLHIYVKAPEIGDTFDLEIVSPNGNETFSQANITTRISRDVNIAIRGTHTIKIKNASRDGEYKTEFGFEVGKEGG